MTQAPSPVAPRQLAELHVALAPGVNPGVKPE